MLENVQFICLSSFLLEWGCFKFSSSPVIYNRVFMVFCSVGVPEINTDERTGKNDRWRGFYKEGVVPKNKRLAWNPVNHRLSFIKDEIPYGLNRLLGWEKVTGQKIANVHQTHSTLSFLSQFLEAKDTFCSIKVEPPTFVIFEFV